MPESKFPIEIPHIQYASENELWQLQQKLKYKQNQNISRIYIESNNDSNKFDEKLYRKVREIKKIKFPLPFRIW